MAFMQPVYLTLSEQSPAWRFEDRHDGATYYTTEQPFSDDCAPDTLERLTAGVLWRLSAPGYLDCTDWSHSDSMDEARAALSELYEVDPDSGEPLSNNAFEHYDDLDSDDQEFSDDTAEAFGMTCPQCRRADRLRVVATVWAEILPDGADIEKSDIEWTDESTAACQNCDWSGTVRKAQRAYEGRKCWAVSYEIVTPESAEHGDAAERGMIGRDLTLRDAMELAGQTRTAHCGGVEAIEPNDSEHSAARWVTVHNGREFQTGAFESRSLHFPAHLTPSSRARLVRLLTK